jgi:branched-chain amino acid transport system ATP-binding protein
VKNIYDTLEEINCSKKMAILVVEQNVHLALKVAGRAYVIENGRITTEGSGSDLLNSEEIKTAYLAMG